MSGEGLAFRIEQAPTAVRIESFDLSGRLVDGIEASAMEPGAYVYRPGKGQNAAGVRLVSLSLDGERLLYRCGSMGAAGPRGLHKLSAPTRSHDGPLGKAHSASALDTLVVVRDYYGEQRVAISAYQGTAPAVTLAADSTRLCPFMTHEPVDDDDPMYRVVYPNGSEVFHVGDTLRVVTTSEGLGEAGLNVSLGGRTFQFPGLYSTFFTQEDTVHSCVIPEEFLEFRPKPPDYTTLDTVRTSAVGTSWLIQLIDYEISDYVDYSDCFFTVLPERE
jgi:hypothetical protein